MVTTLEAMMQSIQVIAPHTALQPAAAPFSLCAAVGALPLPGFGGALFPAAVAEY